MSNVRTCCSVCVVAVPYPPMNDDDDDDDDDDGDGDDVGAGGEVDEVGGVCLHFVRNSLTNLRATTNAKSSIFSMRVCTAFSSTRVNTCKYNSNNTRNLSAFSCSVLSAEYDDQRPLMSCITRTT